jgi:hypothetical protein
MLQVGRIECLKYVAEIDIMALWVLYRIGNVNISYLYHV